METQRAGDQRVREPRHHHPAARTAVEDLRTQRVDVRGQPTFPATALGHMHDLRQRGERRVVVPGDDERAAEN
jgi:hypothetical protein